MRKSYFTDDEVTEYLRNYFGLGCPESIKARLRVFLKHYMLEDNESKNQIVLCKLCGARVNKTHVIPGRQHLCNIKLEGIRYCMLEKESVYREVWRNSVESVWDEFVKTLWKSIDATLREHAMMVKSLTPEERVREIGEFIKFMAELVDKMDLVLDDGEEIKLRMTENVRVSLRETYLFIKE